MMTMLTLHQLGVIVWIGGMFFAHMALRPAANELLEPPVRLPLLHQVLKRFFLWVWLAVISILVSGFWVFLGIMKGQAPMYIHLMAGFGLLMAIIFFYIYFVPFRAMGKALDQNDLPAAGSRMVMIRRLIGVNLVIGLVLAALGGLKLF
ncbi:MAG: hypothetical protein GY703_24305 [Gammaproteobacteria bacterium]|nr:hypothetical protein [Gammaproteobacteria bacterium]